MSVLQDFWAYIKKPYFSEGKDPLSRQAVPILGKLLLTNLGLSIAAFLLANTLFSTADTDRPSRTSDMMSTFDIGRFFIIVAVAPFLEELLFRSWLRKRWGIKYIFPFAAVLPIWLLAGFLQVQIPPLLISLIFLALLALEIWMHATYSDQDSAAYVDRVFPFAFWVSALTFAFLHLTNFKVEEIGILGLIVVLPQFISGIFYGYIVKRFGFWTSFLCHGFWNGSLMLVALALKSL